MKFQYFYVLGRQHEAEAWEFLSFACATEAVFPNISPIRPLWSYSLLARSVALILDLSLLSANGWDHWNFPLGVSISPGWDMLKEASRLGHGPGHGFGLGQGLGHGMTLALSMALAMHRA